MEFLNSSCIFQLFKFPKKKGISVLMEYPSGKIFSVIHPISMHDIKQEAKKMFNTFELSISCMTQEDCSVIVSQFMWFMNLDSPNIERKPYFDVVFHPIYPQYFLKSGSNWYDSKGNKVHVLKDVTRLVFSQDGYQVAVRRYIPNNLTYVEGFLFPSWDRIFKQTMGNAYSVLFWRQKSVFIRHLHGIHVINTENNTIRVHSTDDFNILEYYRLRQVCPSQQFYLELPDDSTRYTHGPYKYISSYQIHSDRSFQIKVFSWISDTPNTLITILDIPGEPEVKMKFNPKGTFLFGWNPRPDSKNILYIWDTQTWTLRQKKNPFEQSIRDIVFHPTNNWVAVKYQDYYFRFYNM
jgi:hypothetical protein